ncbi:SH3 domain-containing kinase-binding protein 1 isoform X2 [Salmo salar]|uniref:SH3 domain-containing kinase-binding protein 1 isoform X2 n=1 Tax=Salmo salar TaxID=8030 RepID=A0A1S3RHC6_SALSA|nr:SH3 domain-containing kinase-binding protein 1 isoform X2 [Salmo salar]|eukprot:XP_014051705.1 PREDICTED: SH3 domain-containing kinase-binding protein 1-like isoform X2 [Salmo salar]
MEPVNGVELPPMELYCDRNTGQTSSALTADIEDFDAIVSVTETLNELAAHVEDERFQSQILSLEDVQVAPTQEGETQEKEELDLSSVISLISTQTAPTNTPVLPVIEKKPHRPPRPTKLSSSSSSTVASVPHPFSTLLPGALSAILRVTLPPHLTSNPKPRREPSAQGPLTLEQLQTELRDLRDEVEMMKSQHNKEIQLLMNELDEEKRIRLSVQMEVAQMKKHKSK